MKKVVFYLSLCSVFLSALLSAQTITWKKLSLPFAPAGRYDDLFFISPQVGWTIEAGASNNAKIYKTTDGGESWLLQFNKPANYLRSICFVDSLHGWVGTLGEEDGSTVDSTILYETTDGGTNWYVADSKIIGKKPAGLCGIFAVDKDYIYIVGKYSGPCYILKTTDGGKSWRSIDMNAYASKLVDTHFWSRDSGIVVGGIRNSDSTDSPIILFTSDGGDSWTVRHRSLLTDDRGFCWKISFPTPQIGFASIEQKHRIVAPYLYTTDGGQTWDTRYITGSKSYPSMQGIGFINENIGWAGGWGGDAYQTTDAGASWSNIPIEAVNRFRFFGDTLGYCAAQYLWKIAVNTKSDVKELGADVSAIQNYPNPFRGQTQIEFTLPRTEHVHLSIYDLQGKKLVDLIDEVYSAGRHAISCCDGAVPLPAGTYFYELETEDGKETGQMVSVK